ncbi:MAG TPA: putative metal-binding motif-containing protein [bacterium]
MKKTMLFLVAALAVVSLFSSSASARSQYLDDVNKTCGTAYDCSFCHETANKAAYLANGACTFCPTATACATPPPPAPTCTDADKDGYFAEPGCAQLYDCDDHNFNINPGAREIPCDGIDQDCSGADKLKGKGCGKR